MVQYDLFGNIIEPNTKAVKKTKKVVPELAIENIETNIQPKETNNKEPEPQMATIIEVNGNNTPKDKVDEKELTKIYYTISEVAKMFDVNASLLRFWEKEFKQLGKIKKNKKGDRYYNKYNIRHLNIIYYLLKEQKMTIAGAREMMKNKQKSTIAKFDIVDNLQQIRSFLVDLKTAIQTDNNPKLSS